MTDALKDQAAQRKAYGVATQRLRETFRIEFDIFLTEAYEEAGVSVRRRKTAEQAEAIKAEKLKEAARKKAEKAAEKVAKAEAALAAAREAAAPALAAVEEIEYDEAIDALSVFKEPATA